MCFLMSCCGWTIDLIQRFWTFVMSCFICWAVCSLLIVTTLAGVALGYNYSLAEYIDMQEGKNVTVYLKRGIFASDYIHYGLRGPKPGGQTNTNMILITISRGLTTTTTPTTVKSVTTPVIATSLSETTESYIRLARSSSSFLPEQFTTMPISLTLPIPLTPLDYGKTGKVPIYGFYKNKYETTTAMNSIAEDKDFKATSRTSLDFYWVSDKDRYKFITNVPVTLSIDTRSIHHKINDEPFLKPPVSDIFYEKTTIDNAKPDIFSNNSDPLLFREAIKANNDMIQRLKTPRHDEEYEYDIQGVPLRKKRNMSFNKVTRNPVVNNRTNLIAKRRVDSNNSKTASEPTALLKILVKGQLTMNKKLTSKEQTINADKLRNVFLNHNSTEDNISKLVAKATTYSTLKNIKDETASLSTKPVQRSHSTILNILRNLHDDKKLSEIILNDR